MSERPGRRSPGDVLQAGRELAAASARTVLPPRAATAGERLRDAAPDEAREAIDAFQQAMLAQTPEIARLMLLIYVVPLCSASTAHAAALASLIRLAMERYGLGNEDYLWNDCLRALEEGQEPSSAGR